MSVREHPSADTESRQSRAEQTTIHAVREIAGENFGVADEFTVYEVDLTNEQGETRENVVIIPRILFENTKDVQYRHEQGIVGKYSLALAEVSDQAKEELAAGIEDKRDELHDEMVDHRETDSRLLNFQVEIGQL